MYHYVRPIKESRFPGIKGLELNYFKRQLDYLSDRFNIISTSQVIDAKIRNAPLPKNACWLTFDDGYKDHVNYVLPELLRRDLHGAFFPPRVAIEEDIVLDVNLTHHILSCSDNVKKLAADLNTYSLSEGVSENDLYKYYKEHGIPNRFDDADTIYVKRMLQHILPDQVRSTITEKLFEDYVGLNTAQLSNELYMSTSDVRALVNNGMYVGSHGSMHYWLNKISREEQEKDIRHSLSFLEEVGAPIKDWVMCYPYGGYNNDTLSIVESLGAVIGVTTDARKVNFEVDNPLLMPRFDTNDFPQ